MTQADSVHSTPPTNTSLTRRNMIGAIAGAAAIATAVPATAGLAEPDPIYAAIKRHRELAKICDAAWKLRAQCNDFGTLTEAERTHVLKLNDAVDEAHLPLEAAAMDLFNTAPTTHAGIITALFYMRIQHRNVGEHMVQGSWRTSTASATSTGAMHGLRPSSRPSCGSTMRRCCHDK
jgi:hypothetical protein